MSTWQKIRETTAFLRDLTIILFFALGIVFVIGLMTILPPFITHATNTLTTLNENNLATKPLAPQTNALEVPTQTFAYPTTPTTNTPYKLTPDIENQFDAVATAFATTDPSAGLKELDQLIALFNQHQYPRAAQKATDLKNALLQEDLDNARTLANQIQALFYKPD